MYASHIPARRDDARFGWPVAIVAIAAFSIVGWELLFRFGLLVGFKAVGLLAAL